MKMTQKQFEQKARQVLDKSLESLDAATLSRLNQARHQALERKSRVGFNGSYITHMATIAAVLLLVVSLVPQQPTLSPITFSPEELEVLAVTDSETLAFYEDLEFYQWLDYVEQSG